MVISKCSVKIPTHFGNANEGNDLISTFSPCVCWYSVLGYTQKFKKWCFSMVSSISQTLFPMEWCSISWYWPNIPTCQFAPWCCCLCPTGWRVDRRQSHAAAAQRLGHADYPDQLLWHGQWKTNLGPSSSPVLHKTCRIFISLNLPFVKGGGCWPTSFNIVEWGVTDQ